MKESKLVMPNPNINQQVIIKSAHKPEDMKPQIYYK